MKKRESIIYINQYSKLSYNFVWDPRLKRGHNFGVVYVTNATQEEETIFKKRFEPLVKNTEISVINFADFYNAE